MKLTIIGASGQGKVIADIARRCGYDELEFVDLDPSIHTCAGYPVIVCTEERVPMENDICVAIGNAARRRRVTEMNAGKNFPVLVHPNAVIAEDVSLGEGTVVAAGAVVNPCTKIGKSVILNTCSSVDHDCLIHDYVHIAVGAHVCGNVEIGAGTWIGAGSTVSNNVTICGGCMIGAGAVVIRDIDEPGTYVGVPARRVRGGGESR